MFTPENFVRLIIDPSLKFLQRRGGPALGPNVTRLLLAICLQESGPDLDARYQNSPDPEPGPARGWAQFEEQGGVAGVLNHPASATLALTVCEALHVQPETGAVWRALEGMDTLAISFARLLLLTDPSPIPTTEDDGWACYERLWRPGAPRRDAWTDNWATATETLELTLDT